MSRSWSVSARFRDILPFLLIILSDRTDNAAHKQGKPKMIYVWNLQNPSKNEKMGERNCSSFFENKEEIFNFISRLVIAFSVAFR